MPSYFQTMRSVSQVEVSVYAFNIIISRNTFLDNSDKALIYVYKYICVYLNAYFMFYFFNHIAFKIYWCLVSKILALFLHILLRDDLFEL